MSRYYALAMSEYDKNSLSHYGVKGQKWGERRYRNEDGSLTAEGREHYGIGEMTEAKRRYGGDNMRRSFAKWREKRHAQNLEKAKASGDQRKIDKYRSKLIAQRKANRDMDKYLKNESENKLVRQNAFAIATGSKSIVHKYRQARARGESGAKAFIESAVPIYGAIKRAQRNKAKYGKRIVWSGLEERKDNIL